MFDHLDRDRVISVQANTEGRSLTEVMTDIQRRLDTVAFPPGYVLTLGGETADQQEVFFRIMTSLGIANTSVGDDGFRLCMPGEPDGKRPTEFASKKGSGQILRTYKRVKE